MPMAMPMAVAAAAPKPMGAPPSLSIHPNAAGAGAGVVKRALHQPTALLLSSGTPPGTAQQTAGSQQDEFDLTRFLS
jgi:hypothetical protein